MTLMVIPRGWTEKPTGRCIIVHPQATAHEIATAIGEGSEARVVALSDLSCEEDESAWRRLTSLPY